MLKRLTAVLLLLLLAVPAWAIEKTPHLSRSTAYTWTAIQTVPGIEFTESDTNPTCAAGNYNIFADLSETKLKKCTNGVASDLDTGGGGGAPTDAGYWVDTANGTLSAERNLGGLTTGLVINTVTAGVGVPSAYPGASCTNQFPRSLDASGAATCASVANADLAANAVDAAKSAVVLTRRTCSMVVGMDNGPVLVNADLGPQNDLCYVPFAATVVEVFVKADGGTPNVIPRVTNVAGSHSALVSSALATAASGARACSNTGGTTGLDATTTCSGTLQNTSVAAGSTIGLASGTAGGTAKRMTVSVTYTVN